MDSADAGTNDTVAPGDPYLDSGIQVEFSKQSRLLRDDRGQMVQLSDEWSFIQQDFKLIDICGEGSFGRVVRASHRVSKKVVAIK